MVAQTAWHCSRLLCQLHSDGRYSFFLYVTVRQFGQTPFYCCLSPYSFQSLLPLLQLFLSFFQTVLFISLLTFFGFLSVCLSRLWWMRSWCCRMRLVSYRRVSLRSWQTATAMGRLVTNWHSSLLSLCWERGWPPFEWRLLGNGSCWRWALKDDIHLHLPNLHNLILLYTELQYNDRIVSPLIIDHYRRN